MLAAVSAALAAAGLLAACTSSPSSSAAPPTRGSARPGRTDLVPAGLHELFEAAHPVCLSVRLV